MPVIEYCVGNDLDLSQMIELYQASTLGERRPVENRQTMSDMLRHANLIVTAWDEELLVGVARTLTDFSYVGYLADLAVRASHQCRGVGAHLIQQTRNKMGPDPMLVLLAAPKASEYYPHIGFSRHESAWILRAEAAIDREAQVIWS